jgi:hypothetical protein
MWVLCYLKVEQMASKGHHGEGGQSKEIAGLGINSPTSRAMMYTMICLPLAR